jgi:meso-butanediol dehydrogenase/(S,S)-butanediol dehydrogenase/diacetyl reductase
VLRFEEKTAIVTGGAAGIGGAIVARLAAEGCRDRIRINALCPAGVWTDSLRAWIEKQSDPAAAHEYLDRIHALGYCAEAEEIAAAAAFLCSDDARFITGCIMPVSGGSECGYNVHSPVEMADPQN